MTLVQALLLGAVQGLTEFLPVSSSGHLVLFGSLLGYDDSGKVFFFVLLHLATLLSVFIYFYKDILKLRQKELIVLAVGTVPAVVVGVLFKSMIESLFAIPLLVSVTLMATGVINIVADKLIEKQEKQKSADTFPTWKQSLMIGIAQAVAITPGISRSGSTVVAGLYQGLTKQRAFTFSFLLSIPAILGATSLELFQFFKDGEVVRLEPSEIFGLLTAFVFGLLSLKLFAYVVRQARLRWFGYYTIAVGCASLFLLMVR